jgi:hypothetical protein
VFHFAGRKIAKISPIREEKARSERRAGRRLGLAGFGKSGAVMLRLLSWKEFIVRLVEALAWPAAVLVMFWFLRREVAGLIRRLTRLTWRGAEAQFAEEVVEAEREIAAAGLPANPLTEERMARRQELVTVAEASPRAAVIEAWLDLEGALRSRAHETDPTRRRSLDELLQDLVGEGLLPRGLTGPIRALREARNTAVHAPDYSLPIESTIDYIDSAEHMAQMVLGDEPEGWG